MIRYCTKKNIYLQAKYRGATGTVHVMYLTNN
jgi:hypothetical protein